MPHGVTSQTIVIFIATADKTSVLNISHFRSPKAHVIPFDSTTVTRFDEKQITKTL
jgi:hypothetical protein